MRLIILSILLCFSLTSYSQTFKAKESTVNSRGMIEVGDEIVFYGKGISWVDKKGNIIYQNRIIEGLASSDFIDAAGDSKGNLYVLSGLGLGVIREHTKAEMLYTLEQSGDASFKAIHVDFEDNLWLVTKQEIIKFNSQGESSVYYTNSEDKELSYAKQLIRDRKGNLFFYDYNHTYKLTPELTLTKMTPKGRVSFQDIDLTENDEVYVLEYRALYKVENDDLTMVFHGNDFVNGLKFFQSIVHSENDMWLLSINGNVFKKSGETWTNYIPLADIKTGNLRESMLQTKEGEVWISINKEPKLVFDGNQWKQIEFKTGSIRKKIGRAFYVGDSTAIVQDLETFDLLKNENSSFVPLNVKATERIIHFKSNKLNTYYWSTKEGLFLSEEGKTKLLVKQNKMGQFGLLGNDIFFNSNDTLIQLSNGKKQGVLNNDHYLGWDQMGNLSFWNDYNGDLLVASSKRRGVLSLYNGSSWSKITSIEGKYIHHIKNIHTTEGKTYIITEKNGVASLSSTGNQWLDIDMSSIGKIYKSFVCSDGSIWAISSGNKIVYIKGNDQRIFDAPITNISSALSSIIHNGNNVYTFYTHDSIMSCEM